MLLTALDPALLIYRYPDWRENEEHCLRRFAALALHRRMIRQYGQKLAMSDGFASVIQHDFPWTSDYRGIGELRDLRQFILEDLQRAHNVHTRFSGTAHIEPAGVVCQHADAADVVDCWKELLCGCVLEALSSEFQPQVATWDTHDVHECNGTLVLATAGGDGRGLTEQHRLPLVWDEDSWAEQLATLDWWPDLHRCVEFCFAANPDMRHHEAARARPLEFECTAAFSRSVDRFCQEEEFIRRSLIKALTKKVYGIQDTGLRDERFRSVRRFRVTRDFRVHYALENDVLVLLDFGHHATGGA